jgi:hypothetical protein
MLDAIKPKLNIVGLDPGQQQTAKGEIEIGFFNISEIRPCYREVRRGGSGVVAAVHKNDVAVPVQAPTPDAAAGFAKVIGGAAAQAHCQSAWNRRTT